MNVFTSSTLKPKHGINLLVEKIKHFELINDHIV
jgi:hypothetical protein